MKRKLICAVLIFFNIFSIIGSTVCLAESPSGIRAAYKSVIDQAYSDYVNSDNSIDTWTYSLYDVNKDGTPELIINDEKSKNIRSVNVYNFDNGKVNYIGSFQPALGELCAYPDGSGIAVLHQLKNHEFIDLYTFNNTLDYAGNLTDSFLVNSDVDYRRPEEIYPGAYTLPKCTVDNYDLLNSVFPNDSFDNKAVNSDGMNDVFSIISGTWENDKGEEVTLRSDGMTDEDAEINCTTTEVVNNSDGSY